MTLDDWKRLLENSTQMSGRSIGHDVAMTEGMLASELTMRLSLSKIAQFGAALGVAEGSTVAAVAEALAEDLAPLILAPLGGFVSMVVGKSEGEVRAKSGLFWRCAVALLAMPVIALRAIALQKCAHVPQLKSLIPSRGDASVEAHVRLVRAVVPWFSMTAQSQQQVEEAKRRAKEAAAARRERDGDGVAEVATKQERAGGSSAAASSSSTSSSTSTSTSGGGVGDSHTYDKGYSRWETFDADAAAASVDIGEDARVASSASARSGAEAAAAARGEEEEDDAEVDAQLRTKVAALRSKLAESGETSTIAELDRAIQTGDLLQIAGLLASSSLGKKAAALDLMEGSEGVALDAVKESTPSSGAAIEQ